MRFFIVALVALLSACGLTTPPSTHCGSFAGFDVYIDTTDAGWAPPSCDAMSTAVSNTIVTGLERGIWDGNKTFDYRLQIVNAKNLADIGSPDAIGETFYGGVKREMFITDFYPPGSIMLHEFIHAAYGDDTHCRWASKYLSVLHATDEVGAFTDQCEHVYCDEAAGECWPN